MLDPDLTFRVGGLLAMAAWTGLLVSLFLAPALRAAVVAARLGVPAILALAYILLIVAGWNTQGGGGFGSIAEVRALFADDSALAAGWLHYLAFDLFVGAWIAEEGRRHGVHPLLLIPCLALTFLFGPAGLLLFLLLKFATSQPRKEIPA